MEIKLVGETPTYFIYIDGITLVRSKRVASIILEPEVLKTPSFIKFFKLPSFSGKDLKELRDFFIV
jgi:hypothetical protein